MNNENKDTANLYIDMLKSHEKAIERVKGLVNDMSLEYVSKRINTKPIKGIVLKLLKEREKLYISIDDKYNISQEFADIIEKDLQNLRDRYTGVIKSLENIIRTRENHLHDEPQHSNESKSRKEWKTKSCDCTYCSRLW